MGGPPKGLYREQLKSCQQAMAPLGKRPHTTAAGGLTRQKTEPGKSLESEIGGEGFEGLRVQGLRGYLGFGVPCILNFFILC